MAKFITLKQIISEPRPFAEPQTGSHVEEEGEDDGLEQSPSASDVQSAQARLGHQGAVIDWKPNTMSVDAIRNFYPRKGGAPGSRVVMKTGTAYIVVEEHAEILALIQA
jgi:hypothetical protein